MNEKEKKKKIPQIGVSLPETYNEWLEKVVNLKIYKSKSEIMRMALKEFIQKESPFIQNLRFDLEKLDDLHRKYIDFRGKLLSEISPNQKFINNE